MELSALHFHSIGLVSTVKKLGTKEISVIPIEIRFAEQEEVLTNPQEDTTSFKTTGGDDSVKVVYDNSITATWLKLNSNRVTAPDVRRNDKVLIWRLGDTDQYYWQDFNAANVKRLETVLYAWSADPENPIKEDFSNAYTLEMSTHNKSITLRTSQANGEPFGYVMQLNTDHGMWILQDTVGNEMYMDSANTVIGFKNEATTEIRMDKQNIHMYAPDSMYVKAEKLINFECTDFKIQASKSIDFKTDKYNAVADSSYTVKTGSYTVTADSALIKASSVTHDSPTTTATGHLNCASLAVGGGGAAAMSADSGGGGAKAAAQSSSGAVVNGSLNVTDSISAKTITADSATFKTLKADSANFGSHGPH